jgi:hypothetical protein
MGSRGISMQRERFRVVRSAVAADFKGHRPHPMNRVKPRPFPQADDMAVLTRFPSDPSMVGLEKIRTYFLNAF